LFIGGRMFDSVTYYNPPLDKINQIDVIWNDQLGNIIPTDTSGSSGTINSFYFTLRIYYFQKRNTFSSFSTSVVTDANTGYQNSIFNPS
jgi:N12 class adenine-specific DNA methylase